MGLERIARAIAGGRSGKTIRRATKGCRDINQKATAKTSPGLLRWCWRKFARATMGWKNREGNTAVVMEVLKKLRGLPRAVA